MMTFKHLLPYLAPPLVGAFIGYVTNTIAIRMLFRPLKPWRIFGLRIPFTPGVLPSRRGQFATTIGKMVGTHLWTSADVARALEKKEFHKALKGAVTEKVEHFLNRDLGTVESLLPPDFQRWLGEVAKLGREKAERELFDYLQSPSFEAKLSDFLRSWENRFLARDLESFLTPERYRAVRKHLEGRIREFLHAETVLEAVAAFVDERIDRLLSSPRPLRELLPQEIVAYLLAKLEKEVPPLLEKFGGMLYDPAFRARLVTRIKEWIEEFLDSMQGLAGLLTGFLNLEKVHAQIPEFLDKASDEIARWLREESTHKQVSQILISRIEDLLDRPVNRFVEKVPFEKIVELRRFTRENVLGFMRSPRVAEKALAVLEGGVEQIKDRSFRSLLDVTLPENGLEQVRTELCTLLLEALRSAEARGAVSGLLTEKIDEWLCRRPLGKLSARIPADALEELDELVYQQLAELLRKEVPPLIETLNVEQMVEEKVNALDILKVEGLLLSIMQEHFLYINLFGALLGFLIGILNVFI